MRPSFTIAIESGDFCAQLLQREPKGATEKYIRYFAFHSVLFYQAYIDQSLCVGHYCPLSRSIVLPHFL